VNTSPHKRLLRIDSSARAGSVSRVLTSNFVEAWERENPGGEVMNRDLATTPLPLITDEWIQAVLAGSSILTVEQQRAISASDILIGELMAADLIIIGAPMHNFTISWPLKAWIDHIVRLGKTVVYDAKGPKGLLTGKKVVIITSRGGSYLPGTPGTQRDFQEPYLRLVLGFIGLTDVTFIHAVNQYHRELAGPARAAALKQIGQFFSQTTGSSPPAPVPARLEAETKFL
jgi:FMN-dependent NADH-azoreductase